MKESKEMIDCCQQEEDVQVAASIEERREQLARFCKALAHPARVHILQFLSTADTCICGDIVEQLPLAQSTVSQHLKVLKEAGLIQGTIDGPRTSYCVNRQALAVFKELLLLL